MTTLPGKVTPTLSRDGHNMARETKIGLLVGLGVILFIGILVSDYLSVAQQPDFGGVNAQANGATVYEQQPVEPAPQVTHRQPLPDPQTDHQQPRDTVQADHPQSQRTHFPYEIYRTTPTGSAQQTNTQRQTQAPRHDLLTIGQQTQVEQQTQRNGDKVHHVQPGDTLSTIAQKYYGDRNYWRTIYDANRDKMTSPNGLRVGVRLVIPKRAETVDESTTQPSRTQVTANTQYRNYTVQPGDSLSRLAQKFMGSQRHTNKLYELNRNVIADPDSLTVGTVIRVPQR